MDLGGLEIYRKMSDRGKSKNKIFIKIAQKKYTQLQSTLSITNTKLDEFHEAIIKLLGLYGQSFLFNDLMFVIDLVLIHQHSRLIPIYSRLDNALQTNVRTSVVRDFKEEK